MNRMEYGGNTYVLLQWPFGCEALMRGVSTDYEGGPTNLMGEEIVGFYMKM